MESMLRRRSTILINRPFQLRFALYVCSWIFAASLIYPFLLQYLFDVFLNYVSRDPMGPPVEQIAGTRGEMIVILVGIQVLLLVITFLISIFTSHRIAGPLYKLRKAIEEAPTRKFPDVHFRKSDHFQELSRSYNQLMQTLRKRSSATETAIQLLEKGETSQALNALKQAR